MLEALALIKVFLLAVNNGYDKVILERDAKVIINLNNNKSRMYKEVFMVAYEATH